MSKAIPGMLEQLSGEIEAAAGIEMSRHIMAGVEQLGPKSKAGEIALFVKTAVDRMDDLLPEEQRLRIMENCGANCARINHIAIDRAVARRKKFKTEEEFLQAEVRKPSAGTRLERDGDILYQSYTPQAFKHPMRCYCALMKGLPGDVNASATYCNCSKQLVKLLWQETLGREVNVEVLQTAISGASECRFMITPV